MIREASLEKWLKKVVDQRGGRCIKLVRSIGIPDRLILLPKGKVVFIELKTPLNDLQPLQIWWMQQIINLGFEAACLNSKEAIINLLNRIEET